MNKKNQMSYNLSTILFNSGNKEFENKNYTASLRYYFDSKRTDYYTYYNISACYYNIGINFTIMIFIKKQ